MPTNKTTCSRKIPVVHNPHARGSGHVLFEPSAITVSLDPAGVMIVCDPDRMGEPIGKWQEAT